MLSGVDLGERGSVREYVLLKAAKRKNDIEHYRFLATMKALSTNFEDRQDVVKLNSIINSYFDVLEPVRLKEREKFSKKSEDTLESFTKYFVNKVKESRKNKKEKKEKATAGNPKKAKPIIKSFEKL
jgi:hypothetical protein